MESTKLVLPRKESNNEKYVIKISKEDFNLLESILNKYYQNLERNRKNFRLKNGLPEEKVGSKPRVKRIELEILNTVSE